MQGMEPPAAARPPLSRRRVLGLVGFALVAGAAGSLTPADAGHVVRPWPPARPVPEFDLTGLDGRRWRLADLAGRVVLLNFWATWCEPCRAEMPSLDAFGERHRDDGVTVLAINYREPAEQVRQFLQRLPFKAPVLLDSDGDATSEWTPRVFPSTVLVGRDGRPSATVVGELDWGGAAAQELLDPMLARPRKA